MKHHAKKIVNELCHYLGEDLDHPMCRELMQHVNECPECKMYLDTVKMTVNICRQNYASQPVPEHVKNDLLARFNIKKNSE